MHAQTPLFAVGVYTLLLAGHLSGEDLLPSTQSPDTQALSSAPASQPAAKRELSAVGIARVGQPPAFADRDLVSILKNKSLPSRGNAPRWNGSSTSSRILKNDCRPWSNLNRTRRSS